MAVLSVVSVVGAPVCGSGIPSVLLSDPDASVAGRVVVVVVVISMASAVVVVRSGALMLLRGCKK